MQTWFWQPIRMPTVWACMSKDTKSGEYIPLTGNMSGSLLCEYVLSQKTGEQARFRQMDRLLNPSLRTNLVDAVAKHYGCRAHRGSDRI